MLERRIAWKAAAMGSVEAESGRVTTSRVHPVVAWVIGVVGIALVAIGGVATFKTENQAGTVTLIVLGAVMAFVGFTRRLPLAFEIAGAKVDATYDEAFAAGEDTGATKALDQVVAATEDETEQVSVDELRQTLAEIRQRFVLRDTQWGLRGDLTAEFIPGRLYRAAIVCSAAGVTYRQLDYWTRTGLVPGVGSPPQYSRRQIVEAKLIKQLLNAGVSLQAVRATMSEIRDVPDDQLTNVYLLSDGTEVRVSTYDEIRDTLISWEGAWVGVNVQRATDEVNRALGLLAPGDSAE
jgi:DNA-binding transcriptional MerR regulator